MPLAVEAIKKVANHFIFKPPEIDDLDLTIRQTLEQTRVRKKLKDAEETMRQRLEEYSASLESKNADRRRLRFSALMLPLSKMYNGLVDSDQKGLAFKVNLFTTKGGHR